MPHEIATEHFFKQLDSNGDEVLQRSELREMFRLADGSWDIERCTTFEKDILEKDVTRNFKSVNK